MKTPYKLNKELLEQLFQQFKIIPKDRSKYLQALTHPSYAHENHLSYNYERYEFIGDSAISWIVSNFLFANPQLDDGQMSIIKAKLVSGNTLANAAKKINLHKLILVGKGLENKSNKVLENVFEAFIGAVANDVGIKKAILIVDYCILEPYKKGLIETSKPYKTLIQEALSRSYKNEIIYKEVKNNNSKKTVELIFDKNVYGQGEANTLKEAEEAAAKNAYLKLIRKKLI